MKKEDKEWVVVGLQNFVVPMDHFSVLTSLPLFSLLFFFEIESYPYIRNIFVVSST